MIDSAQKLPNHQGNLISIAAAFNKQRGFSSVTIRHYGGAVTSLPTLTEGSAMFAVESTRNHKTDRVMRMVMYGKELHAMSLALGTVLAEPNLITPQTRVLLVSRNSDTLDFFHRLCGNEDVQEQKDPETARLFEHCLQTTTQVCLYCLKDGETCFGLRCRDGPTLASKTSVASPVSTSMERRSACASASSVPTRRNLMCKMLIESSIPFEGQFHETV